ncbi:hypothetical protein Q7P35_002464 [Cladosporium inversicolor]
MHNGKISWIYLHDSYLAIEHPLYAERWQTSFINWIVTNDISFEAATDPTLHEIISHSGLSVKDLLPSRPTIRKWLMTTYIERLNDVWSAPNKLSLLGVVGHWLDKERNLKTALLGLRPLDGHAGTDIADVLRGIMATFGLATAKELDSATAPQIRLRCLGHIINLVVKAILFGTTSNTFQKDLQGASDDDTFALWRKQGAIGYLHNLVTYITRSDRRLREFEASQKVEIGDLKRTLHLKRDTGIRWNSTYTMIKRALQLQKPLQRYCHPQDWEELCHFEELLQYFEKATKREVIPTMDYLFAKLKKHAKEVEETPKIFTDYYIICLNHGFAKLSEYYTKIDESPFYAAAVALHPCKRFTYFDEIWRAIAERESSPKQDTLFVQDEDDEDDEDWTHAFGEHVTDTERRTSTLQRRQESELNRFMDDELDIYYTEWRERGESLYPTLATMAYDLFAMLGMSNDRYCLKSDIIEADQCLKSWLKNGIVDGHAAFNNIAAFSED